MRPLVLSRISIIWLALVALSLLSWECIAIAGDGQRLSRAAILIIAFFKVRLVGLEFMELRDVPVMLRAAFEAWVVIICTTLLVLFR